jgi:MFS family permease
LLGGLLGPVFGGIVASFGIRAPFIFYFFTLVAAATVVAVSLRNSTFAGSTSGAPKSGETLTFSQALRVSQYRSLLLSAFSFGWASFGVRVSVIPIFVAVVLDGDAAVAAWVLAAYAAGNAMLIFPSGRWSDALGRKPMIVIGLFTLAASYLAFPASPSLWIAILVMFVAGAGSALVNPGQQATLADVVGLRNGGSVVAGYSMTSDLGGVLGPLIAGAIVDLAGFGWAFGATAALLAVAAVVWTFVPDSRQLQKQHA